jgi:hypothetical protein
MTPRLILDCRGGALKLPRDLGNGPASRKLAQLRYISPDPHILTTKARHSAPLLTSLDSDFSSLFDGQEGPNDITRVVPAQTSKVARLD